MTTPIWQHRFDNTDLKTESRILLNCCVGVAVLVGVLCWLPHVWVDGVTWMLSNGLHWLELLGWLWPWCSSMLQLTACYLKLIPIDPSPCNPTASCPQLCSPSCVPDPPAKLQFLCFGGMFCNLAGGGSQPMQSNSSMPPAVFQHNTPHQHHQKTQIWKHRFDNMGLATQTWQDRFDNTHLTTQIWQHRFDNMGLTTQSWQGRFDNTHVGSICSMIIWPM